MSIESGLNSWEKVVFQDVNPEWCVIRYAIEGAYVIRHRCTTLQQIGSFLEPAGIYRYGIGDMGDQCHYCKTVAPEAVQAVFLFLVSK